MTMQANVGEDEALGRRLAQVQRRVATIQRLWDDDTSYERIVASGRYLKLCSVTEQATETAENLRERAIVALETLGAAGRQPAPALVAATRLSA